MNITEIIAKVTGLDSAMSALAARVGTLEADKAKAADTITKLEAEKAESATALAAANAKIDELATKVSAVETGTKSSVEAIQKSLVALQPSGDNTPAPGAAVPTPEAPKSVAQQAVDNIKALKALK